MERIESGCFDSVKDWIVRHSCPRFKNWQKVRTMRLIGRMELYVGIVSKDAVPAARRRRPSAAWYGLARKSQRGMMSLVFIQELGKSKQGIRVIGGSVAGDVPALLLLAKASEAHGEWAAKPASILHRRSVAEQRVAAGLAVGSLSVMDGISMGGVWCAKEISIGFVMERNPSKFAVADVEQVLDIHASIKSTVFLIFKIVLLLTADGGSVATAKMAQKLQDSMKALISDIPKASVSPRQAPLRLSVAFLKQWVVGDEAFAESVEKLVIGSAVQWNI